MGGLHEAQRVFGGTEALLAMIDSLNATVFSEHATGQNNEASSRPSAH